MRRYATHLTLWSLIAISVLGFFAMHQSHGASPCITETASRATCPEGTFAAIDFHVSAWQRISLATLEASVAAAAALLFLGFIAFLEALLAPVLISAGARREAGLIPARTDELHWLAFHQNSPNPI